MTLREILHAHIPVLRPFSTIRDAVDKMDVYQFPALVIVDETENPQAVITEGDIVRASQTQGGVLKIGKEPVMSFASLSPTTASIDAEVSDALHTMVSSGLTILPVVESGRLMGVVLRVDLMQAMLMDDHFDA